MSHSDCLSNKCGACHRWVINGLICTECLWLLLPLKLCNHQSQCTRQEHDTVLYSMEVPEACEATGGENQAPGKGIKGS
jgi:hypothetical protein